MFFLQKAPIGVKNKLGNLSQIIDLKRYHFAYWFGKKIKKVQDKETTKRLLKTKPQMIPSLSDEIAKKIENAESFLLARLGATEGAVAGQYCERKLNIRSHYEKSTMDWFYSTSGFFADDNADKEEAMDLYAKITIDGLGDCDYLSAFFPKKIYMPFFFKYYAKKATPTFSDFGPYFDTPTDQTWLRGLRGKKVLVINSFADSIAHQYQRKDQLVKDKAYALPDFELLTYKTFVTQVGERPGDYKDFFQVLDKMLRDIKQIDFDVALVGAGAYGFPIAVEIKRMGKIAIETCGKTPAFFGVYGERDIKDGVEQYMTEAWIRPMEEPPKKYKEIENGCYW